MYVCPFNYREGVSRSGRYTAGIFIRYPTTRIRTCLLLVPSYISLFDAAKERPPKVRLFSSRDGITESILPTTIEAQLCPILGAYFDFRGDARNPKRRLYAGS